jgi:hypothetical protein
MKYLDNEETLWESKNKQLLLTTCRLREVDKSFFSSKIKSIMLEELISCELRTTRESHFLRRAVIYFLLLNGTVFLLNQLLFKAEIVNFLFGEVHIGPNTAGLIFYLSIAIAMAYLVLFIFSFKKTFFFYTAAMTIDFQLRWLDFDERESFISKIEAAKDQRHQQVYGRVKKEMKKPAHTKS